MSEDQLPSQEQMDAMRLERLNRTFLKEQEPYVSQTAKQMFRKMVVEERVMPVNAIAFVKRQADVLHGVGFPTTLTTLGRVDFPVQTAPADSDYSPIEYLSTVYPGDTIFPLRQRAQIQRAAAATAVDGMDPIVRRELARKGLLGYEKTKTKLDPKMLDVRLYRGASSPEHMIGVTVAAARCAGSATKRELFERVVRTQFQRRSESYQETVQSYSEDSVSRAAQELQELCAPENITFLLDRISQDAGSWVEQTFSHEPPVIPFGELEVEQICDIFEQDIFWFADWSEEEVQNLVSSFRDAVSSRVMLALIHEDRKTVPGYIEAAFPEKRALRFIELYLGSLDDIVEPLVEAHVTEMVREWADWLHVTMQGSTLAADLDRYVREVFGELMEARDAGEELLKEAANSSFPDNVVAFPKKKTTPEESKSNFASMKENLALLLTYVGDQLAITPPKYRARFFGVVQHLSRAYVKLMLRGEQQSTLTTSDLYSAYRSWTDMQSVYRLFRLVTQDDERGHDAVSAVIDDEIATMPDDEFVRLYESMYANHGAATFGVKIFSETYSWGGKDGYANSLPRARDRLVALCENSPELFSGEFYKEYQDWKKEYGGK